MWTYIFILLLQLGELIELQIVGTISASGLVFVGWFAYRIITGEFINDLNSKIIRKITILYMLLLLSQLASEIIVGNEISNAMKGLAVTILSYMKVICLWGLVKRDGRRITWLFFCMVVSGAISFQFLTDTEFRMESLIEGVEYSIFKFKIAPLIGEMLVVISLITKNQKYLSLASMLIGAACAVLGARSTGLMIFLTGAIVFAIEHMNKHISRQQVLEWSVLGGILSYGLFILYVNAVLSGAIVGGNSKNQFVKVDNPYNPLYILLSGRSESYSSLSAITDKPLTGFGAWAKDPGLKYHKIMSQHSGNVFSVAKIKVNVIPTHSVILGTGVNEGIIAMCLVLCIIWLFIAKGAKSLYKGNQYNYLLVFCIMQLLWNSLFSPVSHFRNGFPVYFCCCLFAYRQLLIKKVKTILI